MKYLDNLLSESAIQYSVTPRLTRWLFWSPFIATVIILVIRLSESLFRFLLEEDGPVEWLTFVCFAATAVIAIRIAVRLYRWQRLWPAILFLGLGVVMVFIAGEEISWGQRLFGVTTPESLAAINEQEEMNLHNLAGILSVFNLALLIGSLYGTFAYLANRRIRVERIWKQADRLFIPPFFLSSFFVPMLIYRLVRLTIAQTSNFTINRMAEWSELCFALGVAVFVWLVYHYLTEHSVEPNNVAG